MLELKSVSKKFGRKSIIKSIDLKMDKKTYGLLGPNGAGKTTLLRILATLYSINSGKITFYGNDIFKDKEYQTLVGYLPQKFGLYKELSSLEMLELIANLKGIKHSEIKEEAYRCIELVGLQDKMNSKVKTLSGGMVRRLGIAQALLGDPEILIFDEPTAGLDPEERLRFKNIITNINNERTIIISTHIVSDVENICDEIIIINDGLIEAQGSCSEIKNIANGKVFEVLDSNIENLVKPYHIQRQMEIEGIKKTIILSSMEQPLAITASPSVEDGYICAIKRI